LILGGKADWSTVLWAVPGVLIGGQIGPRLTQKINCILSMLGIM
jgi:uncharacterized membrane protein YfcA